MAETYVVLAADYKGQKDNPHGGVLHKFYVSLKNANDATEAHQVYWQRKNRELAAGEQVYGHIEDGEYGPRFKTDPRPDGSGSQGSSGGTFTASRYQKEGMTKDEFWDAKNQRDIESQARMGRAHAQEMALRFVAIFGAAHKDGDLFTALLDEKVRPVIDWFHQDVQRFPIDADVGGGPKSTEASPPTADVSAESSGAPQPENSDTGHAAGRDGDAPRGQAVASPSPEASPAQKRKLTTLMGKAGLSRDAMMAVVLWRCRTVKATKDGASKLIQDLMDGATHDTLLAEIHDAKRAGDPLAIRAAALIPSDTPLAEDPEEKAQEYEDESGVPF